MAPKEKKATLDDVLSTAFKQYDLHVGPLSSLAEDVLAISTGNIAIDHIIGVGGIPIGRSVELFGAPSSGKSCCVSTELITPDRGFVRMGDLQVGDRICDPQGFPSQVTGVFPQGVLPVYRLTFNDGTTAEASGDHLWDVWCWDVPRIPLPTRRDGVCSDCESEVRPIRARGLCINCYSVRRKAGTLEVKSRLPARPEGGGRDQGFKRRVVTTDYLRQRSLWKRTRVQLPFVGEFDFDEKPLPLDPYLVGLLLGDGSMTQVPPRFTTDIDSAVLLPRVAAMLPAGVSIKQAGTSISYTLSKDGTTSGIMNPLTEILRDLDMCHPAWEKFVPDIYKYATYQTRLAVLQGLCDTDGNWARSKSEFGSSSERLRDDVVWLARSVGLTCTVSEKDTHYVKEGVRVEARKAYRAFFAERIEVRGFQLDRKLRELRKRNEGRRELVSVEYVGDKECQCISVSAPSRLYMLKDFIPTHNSTVALQTAAVLQRIIIDGGDKQRGISRFDRFAYFDYEHAMDPAYVKKLGLDVEHRSFLFAQPESLEQGANLARKMIETGELRLSIWDSVAAMTPAAKLENETGKSLPAVQARLMSEFLVAINASLHANNSSALFLNHIMELMDMGGSRRPGMPVRTSTPGGRALKFYASLRVEFQQMANIKGKVMDPLSNEEIEQVISTNVKVKVVKNKVAAPFKQAIVRVRYGRGFDNFWTACQILISHKKVVYSQGYFYFERSPELVHQDMAVGTTANKRPYIRGEDSLFEFADEHLEWRDLCIKVAETIVAEDSQALESLIRTVETEIDLEETTLPDLVDGGTEDLLAVVAPPQPVKKSVSPGSNIVDPFAEI